MCLARAKVSSFGCLLVGGDEELLVLGAPEVFGAELDEEGAPVQPLLRGDPMEPAIQRVQRQIEMRFVR